jgi:hypothetical protein
LLVPVADSGKLWSMFPLEEPALDDLRFVRAELQRASRLIAEQLLAGGVVPAAIVIRDVANQGLDRALVQKALMGMVKSGRARVDREFRASVG